MTAALLSHSIHPLLTRTKPEHAVKAQHVEGAQVREQQDEKEETHG